MSGDGDFNPTPKDQSNLAGRHTKVEGDHSLRKWDEFEVRRREFFGLAIPEK